METTLFYVRRQDEGAGTLTDPVLADDVEQSRDVGSDADSVRNDDDHISIGNGDPPENNQWEIENVLEKFENKMNEKHDKSIREINDNIVRLFEKSEQNAR